jgi:hypothetical protein
MELMMRRISVFKFIEVEVVRRTSNGRTKARIKTAVEHACAKPVSARISTQILAFSPQQMMSLALRLTQDVALIWK